MTAPNPLYQEGYSMTDTTDQHPVTRDDALAFADEAFRNRDITFSHRDVVDMTAALGSFLSRHRLASVSSASAEGDDEVIAEFAFLYRAYGLYPDDKLDPDALELKRKVLAAIASPEPVPATNQAAVTPSIDAALRKAHLSSVRVIGPATNQAGEVEGSDDQLIDDAFSTLPSSIRDMHKYGCGTGPIVIVTQPDGDWHVLNHERSSTFLASQPREMKEAVGEAIGWHESEDKALSKQPPSADGRWRRMQHQEQITILRAALATQPATSQEVRNG